MAPGLRTRGARREGTSGARRWARTFCRGAALVQQGAEADEALLSSRSAPEPRSLAPVFGERWNRERRSRMTMTAVFRARLLAQVSGRGLEKREDGYSWTSLLV